MGWIKVDRAITEHWVWSDKPFSRGQAWIDLLLLANHKDESFVWRGKTIDAKRGEICRSVSFLAERWGWSRKKTKLFLDRLQLDQMVDLNCTPQRTSIIVSNYAKYQDKRQDREQQKEQQKNSKRTAEEQQKLHIQEHKEDTTYLNKKEKKGGCAASSPSAVFGYANMSEDELPLEAKAKLEEARRMW